MKSPDHRSFSNRRRERGSILVICVVLAALGTVGIAGWIALLDARSHQAEATLVAVEQRIARENGRALARRALYGGHLHADAVASEQKTHTLPDGLGSVTLSAFGEVPLASASLVSGSRSGATPLRSFSVDAQAAIADGPGAQGWQFQMRSSHPALDGELLVIHPQVDHDSAQPLLSGNLTVRGRATLWDVLASDLPSGFLADEIYLPDAISGNATLRDSVGSVVLPLNYPFRKQTTGLFTGGGPYAGGLEVVSNTPNPHNSYLARATSGGSQVAIDGDQKQGKGKGSASKPPKDNEAEIDDAILSLSPSQLLQELPAYYPLSSGNMKKVLEKDNPPLNKNQLRKILNDQVDVPDDVLEEIAAGHEDRFGLEELEIAEWYDQSGTQRLTGGNRKANLFIDRVPQRNLVLRNVERIVFFGQPSDSRFEAARAMEPLLVVVVNDAGVKLERIDCFHRNGRPFVFAVHHPRSDPADARVTFKGNQAFPSWRGVFELDNTALRFETSAVASVNLVGGIRANRRLHVASGTLTLQRDTEGAVLAPVLARNAWIESFRQ